PPHASPRYLPSTLSAVNWRVGRRAKSARQRLGAVAHVPQPLSTRGQLERVGSAANERRPLPAGIRRPERDRHGTRCDATDDEDDRLRAIADGQGLLAGQVARTIYHVDAGVDRDGGA